VAKPFHSKAPALHGFMSVLPPLKNREKDTRCPFYEESVSDTILVGKCHTRNLVA